MQFNDMHKLWEHNAEIFGVKAATFEVTAVCPKNLRLILLLFIITNIPPIVISKIETRRRPV
jgi:hypothetical protein